MAKLVADSTYKIQNLTVNVKKIPFGTKWIKDSGNFRKGDKYKADRLMSGGSGKILGITIHNTGNSADAETYTRATFNQNMNSSRVHFYVDSKEAWQNLEENEVGWHAGTGDKGLGNDSYMAIEIIMGSERGEADRLAEENGALLTAYLLRKHKLGIDTVVTHKHWSGKECPIYILPHWDEFISLVKKKYDELAPAKTSDNQPDEYAASAVYKAVQGKILAGTPEGDLRLHSAVTRQDLCVVLDRLGLFDGLSAGN
ncbi:MAG: N-acetylmuramoyl-L-alanine amidase [Clostridia bacterium]|nr:N-acetylmuramoyl-L-alanine amidase [Clostridia bacterium]